MNINEIRKKVCVMMHKLSAQGIANKSEAMKLAWANVKLTNALKQGIVEFTFYKVDGSIRQAFGTLNPEFLGLNPSPIPVQTDYNIQKYFDTEKNAWRCFKRVNLCC